MQARAIDFKPARGTSKYQLHSTFNEVTQSIQSFGRQVDKDLWHYLLFTKFDVGSQKAWKLKNEATEYLKFDKLVTFLENRAFPKLETIPKLGQILLSTA